MRIIRHGSGDIPICPLRNEECDPFCPWMMFGDEGDRVCAIALLPMTDSFAPCLMDEVVIRSDK